MNDIIFYSRVINLHTAACSNPDFNARDAKSVEKFYHDLSNWLYDNLVEDRDFALSEDTLLWSCDNGAGVIPHFLYIRDKSSDILLKLRFGI